LKQKSLELFLKNVSVRTALQVICQHIPSSWAGEAEPCSPILHFSQFSQQDALHS